MCVGCSTKYFVAVNRQFSGPSLFAKEHGTIIVRVTNHVKQNATIHWLKFFFLNLNIRHGIKQLRTCWSDAHITWARHFFLFTIQEFPN